MTNKTKTFLRTTTLDEKESTLSLPTKQREVTSYITGETITTRNLSKNLLFLDEYFLDLGAIDQALRPKRPELKENKGTYRKLEDKNSKAKPEPEDFLYHPITVLYPPLDKVTAQDLAYEIFIELINKTDYLLRGLVSSLEKKLTADKKSYQIDQARIRDKFRR